MAKKDRNRRDVSTTDSRGALQGGIKGLSNLSTESGPGRWLVISVVLLLVLTVLYPGAVLREEVFQSSDAINSAAFTQVGDQALAEGDYPLWNPYLFGGMPSFGSLAYIKYLYPPSIVLGFLQQQMGMAPLTWMLAHVLFGGLGMAWLLSRWKLPTTILLLGAVLWIMCPKIVAWGVHGHGTKLGAAMYLPWLVGWALRVTDGAGIRAVGMTALLLGLQLLRGHPQITYYSLLTVGWLVLVTTIWPLDKAARSVAAAIRWRRLLMVVAGLAVGFMLGAILLVPVHQYSDVSIRGQDTDGGGGVGIDYATGWSLAPSELPTLVLPAASGFGKATYMGLMPFTDYPNYLGILALTLAVLAWWSKHNRFAFALGFMALLAIFVSFGNFGFGLYELLYKFLPFFNKIRIPSMILILVSFSVIILAANGLAAWRAGRYPLGKPFLVPAIVGLIGLVLLASGGANMAQESFLSTLKRIAEQGGRQTVDVLLNEAWLLHRFYLIRGGLVLLAAAAALWYSIKSEPFRRHGLVWVLIVLFAVDYLSVDRAITNPERSLKQVGRDAQGRGFLGQAAAMGYKFKANTAIGSPAGKMVAKAVGNYRVWPIGQAANRNTWMADGVRSLGGYSPAKLAAYEQIRKRLYSQQPAGHLANWLGAKIVALDNPLPPAQIPEFGLFGLDLEPQPISDSSPWMYTNRAALPRARLLTQWQLVDTLPEKDSLEPFLDGIQSGKFDVINQVYLAARPDPLPGTAVQTLPEPVFTTDGLNEVVLEVNSPVPALLLLSDMMAPGWSVKVDNQTRPLLTADLVLRAVALTKGQHTVKFEYRDPAVRSGLIISCTGGILTILLLVLPLFRRVKPVADGESNNHG